LVSCAQGGELAGTLKPAERVTSVSAIDRETRETYPATWDGETRKFHVIDLPAGTYDIILETAVGRIEGVNLKVTAAEPTGDVLTLRPSELDKGGILALVAFLRKASEQRAEEAFIPDELLAKVRQARMTAVYLRRDAPAGAKEEPPKKVPLKDEERPQVSDTLLGLISLMRVRDRLPRDYDLVIDVRGGKAGAITVEPLSPEMTPADRKWLTDWVNNLKIFENKKRVLEIEGTSKQARVLVEKLRDKPTTLAAKEPMAIWRVEIFDFRKYYGGWTKEKYHVIVRERVPIRRFRTYRWVFEKRLGGIQVGADSVTTVPEYEIPDKLDAARGRVPY